MIAKKKPPPIRTYKNFFKALRLCQDKYGFKFEFVATGGEIWDDEGKATSNCIWHRSGHATLWNPIEVVHHVFYSPETRLWVPGFMAYEAIGLPQNKYEELVLAYREARGHYVGLRERMCNTLGLEDVPVNRRASYCVIDNMNKRRR